MRKFLHFLAVVGLVIAGIIALVSLFAFVFLKTWKPFGGKAGKTDRKNSWSKNCDADSLGCDYSFTAGTSRWSLFLFNSIGNGSFIAKNVAYVA